MDPDESKKPKTEKTLEVSFKLDEPVTTILNLDPPTSTNEEDSLSFIVLGEDSINARASLLASYVDIQQKSMSMDYTSMVSSLNMTEMQQRLIEMLQENVKLKETLKQNNESMKQQFNTLAMWQDEVTKVHQSHKQKFAETKELINHLKKENAELKTKLWQFFQPNEDIEYKVISAVSESSTINQAELEQNLPNLNTTSNVAVKECVEYMVSTVSEEVAHHETQHKLQQSNIEKELELAMKSLSCNDNHSYAKPKSLNCSETCSAKDQEIAHLKESIDLLKQKLQSIFIPIKLDDLKETSNLNRQKFIQNMKQYNDVLQKLTECFLAQTERFAVIEKILKDITDILKLEDDNSIKQYKEKLCEYCKQFTDEQVKIITDRQTLIKSQNQFLKIFSDYNSILYELEITIDENTKLNVLNDNNARQNLQTLEQLEQIKCEQKLLEKQKKIIDEEKDNLEKEKKDLEDQKKNLDIERVLLHNEIKTLNQEKLTLQEEKVSLDHQSQLYEDGERALLKEKKAIQVRCEQLVAEADDLRKEIKERNTEFQKVIEQLSQNEEEIQLLRSQLTLYEEDFQQEKKLVDALLEEKNKLNTELQKQIEFNKHLQDSIKFSKFEFD